MDRRTGQVVTVLGDELRIAFVVYVNCEFYEEIPDREKFDEYEMMADFTYSRENRR
ncbi:hypothetical protein [Paenibacillus sp.]|uniref:hypothetical protein n=1 Tax=Paenibacillus sp. TaxID=58172 RepID=UPI0028113F7A|nr:hypothetical protein [Paenibacillus sp.]